MPRTLTTSSPVQSLVPGFILAACTVGLFPLLGLPLDWKIGSILLVVLGLASSVSFYDGSRPHQVRAADILMGNVRWNFANTVAADAEEFVRAVSECQRTDSEWNPDQTVLDHGTIEIYIVLLHRDGDFDAVLELEPVFSGNWTQGRLLHALHRSVDVDSLGDHTFFEGLVKRGPYQYYLSLGS